MTGNVEGEHSVKLVGVISNKRDMQSKRGGGGGGGFVSRIEGGQYEKQCGEKSLAGDMLLLELIWEGSPIH